MRFRLIAYFLLLYSVYSNYSVGSINQQIVDGIRFQGYSCIDNDVSVALAFDNLPGKSKLDWYRIGDVIGELKLVAFDNKTETITIRQINGGSASLRIGTGLSSNNIERDGNAIAASYFKERIREFGNLDEVNRLYGNIINDEKELKKHPKDYEKIENLRNSIKDKTVMFAYAKNRFVHLEVRKYSINDFSKDIARYLTEENIEEFNKSYARASILFVIKKYLCE